MDDRYRVALSIAHGENMKGGADPGRINKLVGVEEHAVCKKIVHLLYGMLMGVAWVDPVLVGWPTNLKQKMKQINRLHRSDPFDLALEIHLNDFHDARVEGAETFCMSAQFEAEVFHRHLLHELYFSRVLAYRWARFDRGVKQYSFYFLRKTLPRAVLPEPGFLSNTGFARLVKDGVLIPRIALACYESILELATIKLSGV